MKIRKEKESLLRTRILILWYL